VAPTETLASADPPAMVQCRYSTGENLAMSAWQVKKHMHPEGCCPPHGHHAHPQHAQQRAFQTPQHFHENGTDSSAHGRNVKRPTNRLLVSAGRSCFTLPPAPTPYNTKESCTALRLGSITSMKAVSHHNTGASGSTIAGACAPALRWFTSQLSSTEYCSALP
jgi:hypothetical protein